METSKLSCRRTSILLGENHTTVFNRFSAKAIDAVIIIAAYFLGGALWHPLGIILASLIAAMQDGMGVGQSFGKRIIGLRAIDDPTGISCSFRESTIRNLPFLLCTLCASFFWLRFVILLIAVPWIGLEIYLLITLNSGVRLGDVLANTVVIEYLDEAIATLDG